ncbi:MAG: hypothetical protein LBD16_04730 [Oscillospiraceae bacterium]|jgi:hypothetical protein|nr:hypothetical protein [Oscillospiraceae bacterium]
MNDNVHLNINVSNAESGQGVEDVLLGVFDVLRGEHTQIATRRDGAADLQLNRHGLYIVKPVSYPKGMFSLVCDYEIVYTETGIYLVNEPIDKLNIFLLPAKE